MIQDEFSTFIENALIDEASIIDNFDIVKKITEGAYLTDELATKLNFDSDYTRGSLARCEH